MKALVAQWQKAGAAVETLAGSPETKQMIANLNATLTELRTVLAKLDTQIATNGSQLQATLVETRQTLATFNAAADTARRFINAQGGIGEETSRALAQLSDAADAVQRLAEYLERNPQALLTGKHPAKH